MNDKYINIILQNLFGSYSNRILAGINLIQMSTTENYQLSLKFSNNHSVVWEKIKEYDDKEHTFKLHYYTEYKTKFPSTRLKFIKENNQELLTRLITILDVRESQDSNASISIAYVDAKKFCPNNGLCEHSIYKIDSEHVKLFGWDIANSKYTYGESTKDKRLLNGPIDRTVVECSYVGIPRLIKENLLKLLGLIDKKYDYKSILLDINSVNLFKTPSILTNRFMNKISPRECTIYKTNSTDFYNIITYENLWNPEDVVIVKNGKEIYNYSKKSDITTKYYSTVISQALCTYSDNTYYILEGDVPIDSPNFHKMEEIKHNTSWANLIKSHHMFIVEKDSNYYYYNNDISINYDVTFPYKTIQLWKFIFPSINQNYNQIIKINWKQGKYYDSEVTKESSDNESDMFDKLCTVYSSKFSKLETITKFSSIIKLMYQYISESIFSYMPHNNFIHIFDFKNISSMELVKFCKINELILVGKKSNIVEYFERLTKENNVGMLFSTTLINDTIPQIEVVNPSEEDFINNLIKCTSFINNSIDVLYLQNNFTKLNTFSKLIEFALNSDKILCKRGHLCINFFNLANLNKDIVNLKQQEMDYSIDGVSDLELNIIDVLFSPSIVTKRIGHVLQENESILIDRNVDEKELLKIYNIRKDLQDVYTVVISNNEIYDDSFERYKLENKYIYVLYPKYKNIILSERIQCVVHEAFKNKKILMGTIDVDGLEYYAIDPLLLSVFGEYERVVIPFKTQIINELIAKNSRYTFVTDPVHENILNSMQLNIY